MLLITGANGNLAGRIIENLRQRIDVSEIAVTTSNPDAPRARALAEAGIMVRRANFNDPSTLPRAFEGMDKVLLIPTWDDDSIRIRQNLSVIDAAKAAGVPHFYFASFIDAEEGSLIGRSRELYYPTEQAIHASGMVYTILRDAFYAEAMFPGLDIRNARRTLESGVFEWLGGDAACAYIARDDAALAFAAALASDSHQNRTYTLTMPRTYTGRELAEIFCNVFGRPVEYRPITRETWVDWWKRQRDFVPNPEEQAHKQLGLFQAMWNGDLDIASDDYEHIVGHKARSFEQLLRDADVS